MSDIPTALQCESVLNLCSAVRECSASGKNDIKVSAEGVAKLTFNFLDEMHGDSSLEPGEVKTPPQNSPSSISVAVTQVLGLPSKPKVVSGAAADAYKNVVSKSLRIASQLDAEVCQEKVRAILALDAIKRKEEVEKRKEQMEMRRCSGEVDKDQEQKKKAKEERKRLKRLKREQNAARLALLSDEESEVKKDEKPHQKSQEPNMEREGLYSNSSDSSSDREEQMRCALANAVTVPTLTGGPLYPGNLPPTQSSHLPPYPLNTFMGFHGMNPFMRCVRPDFLNMRGGFVPRGRGCMRGGIRFPGFRSPFYNNGPPRNHAPQVQRLHTPPPVRGHSPIQPPNSNMLWTKTKPSISYGFNTRKDIKPKLNTTPKSIEALSVDVEKSNKHKKHFRRSSSKQRHKPNKSHESEKVKKRRSSHTSSEKSSKRKIEQIRNSMKKNSEKSKYVFDALESTDKLKKQKLETLPKIVADENDEYIPYTINAEEMQHVLNKIKVEKIDDHLVENISSPILLKTDSIKVEMEEKSSLVEAKSITALQLAAQTEKSGNGNSEDLCDLSLDTKAACETANDSQFDMFAESPPRRNKSSVKGTNYSALRHTEKIAKTDNAQTSKQKADDRESRSNELLDERDKGPAKSKLDACASNYIITAIADYDGSTTPPPVAQKSVEKTTLQMNLDIQKRIDKLLQDDDLKLENIQATKAKLLEKSKKLARDSISSSKTTKEKRCTVTPEPPKHRNPFKRSVSRDRFFGRINSKRNSRSRTRECDATSRRGMSSTEQRRHTARTRSHSGDHDWCGSTGSLRRSYSKDNDKRNKSKSDDLKRKLSKSPHRRYNSNSKYKSVSLERKTLKSNTPPLQKAPKSLTTTLDKERDREKDKGKEQEKDKDKNKSRDIDKEKKNEAVKVSSKKKSMPKRTKPTPLSFTAAEFLFPEDVADNYLVDAVGKSSPKPGLATECTQNSKEKAPKCNKEASPDTDDYMDNWENEEPDVEGNSNSANEAATPFKMLKRQEKGANDNFVARFVNPSPPSEMLQKSNEAKEELEGSTPQNSPPINARVGSENFSAKLSVSAVNRELFGMQELYDQFIKSVEQSGVHIKPSTTPKPTVLDHGEEQLSSSTCSSSSSSSSDGTNSSSSSSSSTTASSSEDSNDNESFHKLKIPSPQLRVSEKNQTAENITATGNQKQEKEDVNKFSPKSATPISTPPRTSQPVDAEPSTTPPPPLLAESMPKSTTTVTPVKNVKPDAIKDFKKLRSLETNLARIQMMRATYDTADEISEELIKMEKLFLQEKNLILIKYAKSAASKVAEAESEMSTSIEASAQNKTETAAQTVDSACQSGKFVTSLQETDAESGDTTPNNRIFDSNREAIKLTISPVKLPKTPAVFEKENDRDSSLKRAEEPEESDFTERLIKPPKEVAIVKPMMESKESHSSYQRLRRSPPRSASSSSTAHERPRSPSSGAGAYRDRDRDRGRSSVSRSRLSPQRRGRARSLSDSPPRRGNGRHISPQRRANNLSRYRGSGRRSRSRSRSRSISKQPSRRGGDLSPQIRRRWGAVSGRKGNQSRFQRDSRSRSPRSPPPRPHSPRSPPPAMSSRRRSYSRERYSRSPLPFKPPSPPMRCSLSPLGNIRCRSRSMSRSCSPTSHTPRSPRSPPSPSRYEDDHRRRRASSYECHSISPQMHQYYVQDSGGSSPGVASSTSSYYYNVSPNRISLDARINIVLNDPHAGQEETDAVASYENYSDYGQYGNSAYMPLPPHPMSTHETSMNPYYTNQYVPMSSSGATESLHCQQPMYSNIPTIGGSGAVGTASSNYYYNEYCNHPGVAPGLSPNGNLHQPNSLLKELPKATVAVQKGNVLEIVPTSEIPSPASVSEIVAIAKTAKIKKKRVTVSWKEEVSRRQLKVEVLKLSRESESDSHGAARSILKKSEVVPEASKEEGKSEKKKVYFEDGIFPNHDSDYEDRLEIEDKIRRKLRKLSKITGQSVDIPDDVLITNRERSDDEKENKISIELEKRPPPPPPPGSPPPDLDQPIYRRPPTPTPMLYFHFDPVVHSMYISQLERAIPPRLLNPKCVNSSSGASGAPQSPSQTLSSVAGIAATSTASSKKEVTTPAAPNRSNESSSGSPPKLVPSLKQTPICPDGPADILQMSMNHADQHIPPNPHLQTLPPPHTSPALQNTDSAVAGAGASTGAGVPPTATASASPLISRGTFQAIPVAATLSPQMVAPHSSVGLPGQAAPIGFVGMRINNVSRLLTSPLARPIHPTPTTVFTATQQNAIPVVGIRHHQLQQQQHQHHQPPPSPVQHLYHMAPQTTESGMPSTPLPTVNEFGQPQTPPHPHLHQQQHQHQHSLPLPHHQQYPFPSGPPPLAHHYHAPPQHRTPTPGYFLPSPQAVRNMSPLVEICPTPTSTPTPTPQTPAPLNTVPPSQVMASGRTDVLTAAVSPQAMVETFTVELS